MEKWRREFSPPNCTAGTQLCLLLLGPCEALLGPGGLLITGLEKGQHYRDPFCPQKSSTQLNSIGLSLTRLSMTSMLQKGAWNMFSTQVTQSDTILFPVGTAVLLPLWIEKVWRSKLLQTTGCSCHLLFLSCSSITLLGGLTHLRRFTG